MKQEREDRGPPRLTQTRGTKENVARVCSVQEKERSEGRKHYIEKEGSS